MRSGASAMLRRGSKKWPRLTREQEGKHSLFCHRGPTRGRGSNKDDLKNTTTGTTTTTTRYVVVPTRVSTTHRRSELLHSLVVVLANGSHGFEALGIVLEHGAGRQGVVDAGKVLANPPGRKSE